MKLLDRLRHEQEQLRREYTPYVMGGLAGVFVFFIVAAFALSTLDHHLLRSGSLAAVISSVLVDLTNGDRGANELGGLAISSVLNAAAQAKADDMAAKSYFAHVSPEGRDSWYWFRQQGYSFIYAGENLAIDFSDSIDVERAWMNSPTHRANILGANFTEIGIATAPGVYQGRPTTFVVQMFGTPNAVASPKEPTAPALATTEQATDPFGGPLAPTAAVTETLVLGTGADSILPPTASPVRNLISNGASWWQRVLASPKSMLQYAYYGLAGIILVLLAFVTELEFHRRHLRHVRAAALLFVLMAGLFVLANFIFFSEPNIAAGL